MNNTVIIAHRRRGQDYWEGYTERTKSEAKEWVNYFRSSGNIVKVFPSLIEYRSDCGRLLDKIEAKLNK